MGSAAASALSPQEAKEHVSYGEEMPEDILTGFLNADGDAQGRPVGVAIDSKGALLVADDVGNAIWRVKKE